MERQYILEGKYINRNDFLSLLKLIFTRIISKKDWNELFQSKCEECRTVIESRSPGLLFCSKAVCWFLTNNLWQYLTPGKGYSVDVNNYTSFLHAAYDDAFIKAAKKTPDWRTYTSRDDIFHLYRETVMYTTEELILRYCINNIANMLDKKEMIFLEPENYHLIKFEPDKINYEDIDFMSLAIVEAIKMYGVSNFEEMDIYFDKYYQDSSDESDMFSKFRNVWTNGNQCYKSNDNFDNFNGYADPDDEWHSQLKREYEHYDTDMGCDLDDLDSYYEGINDD